MPDLIGLLKLKGFDWPVALKEQKNPFN